MNIKYIFLMIVLTHSSLLIYTTEKSDLNYEKVNAMIHKAILENLSRDLAYLSRSQPQQIHIHNSSQSACKSDPIVYTSEPQRSFSSDDLLKELSEKGYGLGAALEKYKWYIAGGILTSSYAYLLYRIYHINKLLDTSNAWHMFKEEIPLTRLTTLNRAELFKELHLAICKKYLKPTDCDTSQKIMMKFLDEITYEKSLLESYLGYQNMITSCYLSRIFPSFKKSEHIQESIARLNFLTDLYIEFFIVKDPTKLKDMK